MVRTVVKVCREVNYGISCKNTLCHSFEKSLFNCGIEVLRNGTADNGLCECKSFSVAMGESHLNVTVLTGTAGLLLVLSFDIRTYP